MKGHKTMNPHSEATAARIQAVREAHALRKAGRTAEALTVLQDVLDGDLPPMAAAPLRELRDLWRTVTA